MVDYTGMTGSVGNKVKSEKTVETASSVDPFLLQIIAADIAFNGLAKYQSVTGRMDNHKAKAHLVKLVEVTKFIQETLKEIL